MKVELFFYYKGSYQSVTVRSPTTNSAFPSYLQSLRETHDPRHFTLINARRIGVSTLADRSTDVTNSKRSNYG
jgi:hypothetical protein